MRKARPAPTRLGGYSLPTKALVREHAVKAVARLAGGQAREAPAGTRVVDAEGCAAACEIDVGTRFRDVSLSTAAHSDGLRTGGVNTDRWLGQ